MELVNKQDKAIQEGIDEKIRQINETGNFRKLLPYNKPTFLIFLGVICSMVDGSLMPLVGLILSKLLGYMTATWEQLNYMASADKDFTPDS